MTVTSRFNYRAYPDKGQCQALARLFGCVRVVYNDFVAARRAAHSAKQPIPSANDLCKRLITDAKKTPERAWLAEVSVTPLQQAARHAQGAHARFYSYLKARREFNAKIKVGLLPKDAKPPRRVGRPVFKTRSGRQSAEFTRSARFQVRHPDGCKWGWVRLPKIGWVKFRWTRDLPSDPSSVVVIGNPDGSYEVSFAVDAPIPDAPAPIHQATGIDLGHRVLAAAVSSDGTRRAHPNPKALDKARRRLRLAEKSKSRKRKGSNNRRKQVRRIARLHKRVADIRKDNAHKLSTALASENQAVAVEKLDISQMMAKAKKKSSRRLRRDQADAGWGQLLRMLETKLARWSRVLVKIPAASTSNTCALCGWVHPSLGSRKQWVCGGCGVKLDRDFNAALNILDAAGLAESLNACGGSASRQTPGAATSEAGTRRTLVYASA